MKTIINLPDAFTSKLRITVNDWEFDVAARNIILLLSCLVSPTEDEAVDCMIHLWYSSLITKKHADFLGTHVYPLIDDVCQKVQLKNPINIQAKTFSFGSRSLRIGLKLGEWVALRSIFLTPNNLTAAQAQQIRRDDLRAPEVQLMREGKMFMQAPTQRMCDELFRNEGILLPHGWSQADHDQPNPQVHSPWRDLLLTDI